MTRRILAGALLGLCLCLATPARGQSVSTPTVAHVADAASTVGALGAISLSAWRAYKSEHRLRAFTCTGLRIGLASLSAEVTKRYVQETRPDGSDRKSFFSEHTAVTAAAIAPIGWNVGFTFGVGLGRIVADKHYPWDVAVGAGVGALTHWLPGCR